jgi:hypothetical protein
MRLFRSSLATSVLLTLLLAAGAEAAVTVPGVPGLAGKDLSESFPNTAVGQTSILQCLGLCFKQPSSPEGTCDASGTETLEKALAAPFFANNFRKGSASQCGGTPVTLPTSIGPGQALWFDAGFSPTRAGSFSDSLRITGFTFSFSGSTGTRGCTPSATTLCLNGNRFAVTATWTTADGQTGGGQAVPLTADTGYFWFFSASNVEMVLKVLDACSLNQRFWVFAGGLTNVKVDITVRDTVTGTVKTYHNPQGTNFNPIQDTSAFGTCSSAASGPRPDAGVATGTVLSVGGGRFRITTAWKANGQTGSGQAVQLTDETGYFWFFSPDNVEMLVKVLDACSFNQRFWVFAGGLTNVQVDMTVVDTVTQTTRTYHNPQGTPFQPVQDTNAFATCSSSGGLPPDPGDAGKVTLGGIDSDHDGVRDDLQRYIALTYAGSPATVSALRQTAKVVQSALLDNTSPGASINHATDLARALECLEATRPADAMTVHQNLVAQTLNTEQRGLAFLAFNDQLGGAVFPLAAVNDRASSCDATTAASLRSLGLKIHPAAAQSCQQKATVFFGNGVWNTCCEAQVSANALADAVQPLLTSDERSSVSFALACNPTKGKIADAWRVTKQYFVGNFTAFYSALVGIVLTPDPLVQELLSEALVLDAASVIDDPTLRTHVSKYQSLLLEGQKVVVASHSQGNFYSNFASQALTDEQRQSFGIVAVATPSDHVEGGWDYTTLKNDRIIGVIPFAQSWNVDNGAQSATDSTGHQFVLSYLAPGSASRGRIVNQVVDELRTLPSPSGGAGNGIITITLTWDGATDVDLHVFEPGGAHVYYADKTGDSGYLDVDNTTGFGPEHYYVGCDTVQTGTYHVGVNYYAGFAPETAHIQVSAGLVSRSFNIRLPNALGSDGNGSPQPVADIVVSGNATTGYTFDVQSRF